MISELRIAYKSFGTGRPGAFVVAKAMLVGFVTSQIFSMPEATRAVAAAEQFGI